LHKAVFSSFVRMTNFVYRLTLHRPVQQQQQQQQQQQRLRVIEDESRDGNASL